jgi:adenylate cyclase
MDASVAKEFLSFECWRFDRRMGELFREDLNGAWLPVAIGSRAISVLSVLLDRPGTLVVKDVIMGAVWPRYVEPNNLTVQIAALRRVLDAERVGASCIQTIPGRGYRFVIGVTKLNEDVSILQARLNDEGPVSNLSAQAAKVGGQARRLSMVVLPFVTSGGNRKEECLAAAVTEGLTTELCRIEGAFVSAGHAATTMFRDQPIDVRAIGDALRVRYIVDGRLRNLGNIVRVNVQLISTETNTYLWACRFDHKMTDIRRGQDEIVSRLKAELATQMLAVESARSLQERPNKPDSTDLLLRARALLRKHDQTALLRNASGLLEEALRLDPSSVSAMCDLASQLLNRFMNHGDDQGSQDLLEQAMAFVAAAAVIEPNNEGVIYRQGYLARALGRWREAIALLQRLVELFPHSNHGFRQLGFCKLATGQAEAAIPLLERSIYLDPLAPANRYAYQRISQALLLLGRDAEAIDWARRALAEGTFGHPNERAYCYWLMASALATTGQIDDARRALAEANQLMPFATVQTLLAPSSRGLPDPAYVALMGRMRQGLRVAGMREHADEYATCGLTSDGNLSRELYGVTPSTIPGATTIRTSELVDLRSRLRPILIDTASNSYGRSLPGAIGLQGLSHGSPFSDGVQTRFCRKIRELTNADRSMPIVAYCVNSERFASHNMVIRLVALGYTQVYWYRGGWEAWLGAGLPNTELALQSW